MIPTLDKNEIEIISRMSHNVSGLYTNPSLGFKIILPEKWSGIEANILVTMVSVSPSGILPADVMAQFHSKSVSMMIFAIPKVVLETIMSIASAFGTNDSSPIGNSNPLDLVQNVKQGVGCKGISSSIDKLSNTIVEEYVSECDSNWGYTKTKTYSFATEQGFVAIVYSAILKEDYDNNFHKFDESIKTLTVSEPIDIRNSSQELFGVTVNSYKFRLDGREYHIRIDSAQNISNFIFDPLKKQIAFSASDGKALFGAVETRVNVDNLLSSPYTVTIDGNQVNDFVVTSDKIDNKTILDLTYSQGIHKFIINGK